MKKAINIIAISVLIFACSKADITTTDGIEVVATAQARGGNGNGNGGGNGGGPGGGGGGQTITTNEASYILPFGVTSGGVVPSGGANSIIERGVCYSINSNPTVEDDKVISGSGSGAFTSILSWLDDNTTYYARAYIIKNKNGNITTKYGNEISFTTTEAVYGTVTDIDGNVYTTIEIGSQVWMMENLKTTKYSDGAPIDYVTGAIEWGNLSTGAYCNYNNDMAKADIYGRLYNGYAVETNNLAPEGWHVATRDDVQALLDYVGEREKWAGKLKEAGFTHWNSPNWGAENSSGFTALPGGARMAKVSPDNFEFDYLRYQGRWWANSTSVGGNLDYFYMQYSAINILGSFLVDVYGPAYYAPFDKRNGYSVRCVKDL